MPASATTGKMIEALTDMDWRARRCIGCGQIDAFLDVAAARSPWDYRRCRYCRGCEIFPMPSAAELEVFYNSGYVIPRESHLWQMRRAGPRFLRQAAKLVAGRKLLEVGCSYGGLLREARRLGWQATGVDLSTRAVAQAGADGLEAFSGTLEENEARLSSQPWDCAFSFHVIEHLTDPESMLRSIHRLLVPGGLLLLRTPNADALAARWFGRGCEAFAEPEHLRVFSPDALGRLVQRCGFNVVTTRTGRGEARSLLGQGLYAWFWVDQARSNSRRARESDPPPDRLRLLRYTVRRALDHAGTPADLLWKLAPSGLLGPELILYARKP